MNRKKEFKLMEKSLQKEFINIKSNEVILRSEDFYDYRLTKSGYLSIKHQSDYIKLEEDIELRIPIAYQKHFKRDLEYLATKELLRLKTDMRDANIFAITFFLLGLLLILVPTIFPIFNRIIINELILIIAWVFTWAAVEKRFFSMYRLKARRNNIIHILTSRIITY